MNLLRKASIVVLFFMFVLFILSLASVFQGCSSTGPLMSYRENRASVIIEKPPTRIILSGEYDDIDVDNVLKIMREIKTHRFHDYNFDDSISIESESIYTTKDHYSTTNKRSRR